jgi:hypothetical protein
MKPASPEAAIAERYEDTDRDKARIALRFRCRAVAEGAQSCIAFMHKISTPFVRKVAPGLGRRGY